MKNILVLTDFSKNAWEAIKYAISFFNNQQACTFYLLNTYTPSITTGRFIAINNTNETSNAIESTSKLKDLIIRIQKEYPKCNHNVQYISSFSLLVNEVKDIIKEKGIDVTVIGAKGVSNSKEDSLGSSTLKIINAVNDCALLIIPETGSL